MCESQHFTPCQDFRVCRVAPCRSFLNVLLEGFVALPCWGSCLTPTYGLALASLEDTSQDVSLIDTLRRMEKYGVVQNLNDWLEIRLLRNSLTHEFLTDGDTIAENINAAFAAYTTLIDTLNRIKANNKSHIRLET